MISDSDEDDVCVTEKYIKDNDTLKKYGWAGNKQLYYKVYKLVECTAHLTMFKTSPALLVTCNYKVYISERKYQSICFMYNEKMKKS